MRTIRSHEERSKRTKYRGKRKMFYLSKLMPRLALEVFESTEGLAFRRLAALRQVSSAIAFRF